MKEQIKLLEAEYTKANNNWWVLFDCNVSQEELDQQAERVRQIKQALHHLKEYDKIRVTPPAEDLSILEE